MVQRSFRVLSTHNSLLLTVSGDWLKIGITPLYSRHIWKTNIEKWFIDGSFHRKRSLHSALVKPESGLWPWGTTGVYLGAWQQKHAYASMHLPFCSHGQLPCFHISMLCQWQDPCCPAIFPDLSCLLDQHILCLYLYLYLYPWCLHNRRCRYPVAASPVALGIYSDRQAVSVSTASILSEVKKRGIIGYKA